MTPNGSRDASSGPAANLDPEVIGFDQAYLAREQTMLAAAGAAVDAKMAAMKAELEGAFDLREEARDAEVAALKAELDAAKSAHKTELQLRKLLKQPSSHCQAASRPGLMALTRSWKVWCSQRSRSCSQCSPNAVSARTSSL